MLTHTGEKRHQCPTCGKRFTKSHHLKSHLNTHLKAQNKQASITQPQTVQRIQESSKIDQQRINDQLIKHEPPMQVQNDQDILNVINFQVIHL